ncbi:MAG: hypothetical protein HQ508_06320 [Candidatus Marinimicrobia bacterium]|nr:hypothetical protein [Candidatus Neomarinimicrobiota bacterium]
MWDLVSFMAGLLVFMVLIQIAVHIYDVPEWIAKRFNHKPTRDEIEARLLALEARVDKMEQKDT